jgi:hypothetical protein
MKKTLLSKIPVLGLILTGIFLVSSASGVVAQVTAAQTTAVSTAPPQGPFVSPSAAIEQLDIEATALKEAMSGMTEGTFAYKQTSAKHAYFEAVRTLLIKGTSVSDAIVQGLLQVPADQYGVTQQNLLSYQQEVITMLSS